MTGLSSDEFRRVMGHFATGVTVATMPSDPVHGMTANAVSSVSLDPPLVLICVDHETESYELFAEDEIDGFCINILTADQQPLGEHFAGMAELDDDPFESRPTRTAESGAPIFTDSLAFLDCSRHSEHRAGDHTIYVGHVEAGESLNADAPPLTFYTGDWGTLASE